MKVAVVFACLLATSLAMDSLVDDVSNDKVEGKRFFGGLFGGGDAGLKKLFGDDWELFKDPDTAAPATPKPTKKATAKPTRKATRKPTRKPIATGGRVVYLRQRHFKHGTYRITKPGRYVLAENISFNPNNARMLKKSVYESSDPLPSQLGTKYDKAAYGLGFFCAIAIEAKNVVLDLNKKTIRQSREHMLLQRFFAVIETAGSPFIPGQGPHNFGKNLRPGRNVVIKNGRIGQSAHHGIHGNSNYGLTIKDVTFDNFEVAAISLNGQKKLRINNVKIVKNRQNAPLKAIWSHGRFLRPFINYLVDNAPWMTLNVNGKSLTPIAIRNQLKKDMETVHRWFVYRKKKWLSKTAHPKLYALMHNPTGRIDGNAYCILVNNKGIAVNDFPKRGKSPSRDVRITNVDCRNLDATVDETVGLPNAGGGALVDPIGAMIQLVNRHHANGKPVTISTNNVMRAYYVGNVIANAQMLVGKAILDGEFTGSPLETKRCKITQPVIDWVEAGKNGRLGVTLKNKMKGWFKCAGDGMNHINKGVVGIMFNGVVSGHLENVKVHYLRNRGKRGSSLCKKLKGKIVHHLAHLKGYHGGDARGFSFAGDNKITVKNCLASNINADHGSAFGYDVMTDSRNVHFTNCRAYNVRAALKDKLSWYKSSTSPNPKAVGIHVTDTTSNVSVDGARWVGSVKSIGKAHKVAFSS